MQAQPSPSSTVVGLLLLSSVEVGLRLSSMVVGLLLLSSMEEGLLLLSSMEEGLLLLSPDQEEFVGTFDLPTCCSGLESWQPGPSRIRWTGT